MDDLTFVNATFSDYQKLSRETAEYPNIGFNLVYPAMGVSGEAGELCDKIKKYWRNARIEDEVLANCDINSLQRDEIIKEMGDVLWYLAALSTELGIDFGLVASHNLVKLRDRQTRNVIKGEGDNR